MTLANREAAIETLTNQLAEWNTAAAVAAGACGECGNPADEHQGSCDFCGRDLAADLDEHGTDGAQLISIDERTVSRLQTGIGAIDYDHATGRAVYLAKDHRIDLTDDETDTLVDLFHLHGRIAA